MNSHIMAILVGALAVHVVAVSNGGPTTQGKDTPIRRKPTDRGNELKSLAPVRRNRQTNADQSLERKASDKDNVLTTQASKEETICDTSYNNGTAYGKGAWVQREAGLTNAISDRSGKLIAMKATEKGLVQLQLLRDQHERLKGHGRACLWRNESEAARVLASMNWAWKPSDCKLEKKLSFETLPAWLKSRGASLRFYGDSLNKDMALQLMSRVSKDAPVSSYRKDKLGAATGVSLGQHFWMQEKNEDMKSFLDALELPNVPWADENISSSDILVLNAGAHWNHPAEETKVAFTKVAKDLWELPQHKQPKAIIFRTTVMGHDSCLDFFEPLQAEAVADSKKASKGHYNWDTFTASNAAIIQAFKGVWPPGRFRVLDVSMFEHRGDGHNGMDPGGGRLHLDCLHYCVPGPSMVWNELLLHVLSQLPS